MSILTWLKELVQQAWFQALLNSVINAFKKTVTTMGQNVIVQIKAKIVEVSSTNMSGQEKMKAVLDYAISIAPSVGESSLRFLIESLIQDLKSNGTIG